MGEGIDGILPVSLHVLRQVVEEITTRHESMNNERVSRYYQHVGRLKAASPRVYFFLADHQTPCPNAKPTPNEYQSVDFESTSLRHA